MIDILDKLKEHGKGCTGCGACCNICVQNAIDMVFNVEGFLTPSIKADHCIQCMACVNVCPALNPKFLNDPEPECYAIWATDDIRSISSSGGVFTVLAEEILKENGVVFGAAWTEDFFVQHKGIDNHSDLHQLRKSKYVQSNTADTFRQVKKLLLEGRAVLYTGTPCQIAGLQNFLGKKYERLLTVDLICSHTPPITLYHKYLDENFGIRHIRTIEFRDKRNGWICDAQRIVTDDDQAHLGSQENDWWQKAFHPKLMENTTCIDCPFAKLPRQGDLSMGDFWFIGEKDPSWDDGKGTSALLINNEKGRSFFNNCKDLYQRFEKEPKEWLLPNRIYGKNPRHSGHDRFYDLLHGYSFNRAAELALYNRFDVGIVGVWLVKNYGNNLSYYALYQTIRDMGFTALMIERAADAPTPPIEDTPPLFRSMPYPLYALSEIYPNKTEMKALNWKCDTFVLGSDQLLDDYLYKEFGEHVNLSWVHDSKRKIAYAASLGHDKIQGAQCDAPRKAYYFKKFDAFSMRESTGVHIMKELYDVDCEFVLDPVFLCDFQKYEEMAALNQDYSSSCPYIGGYILDPDTKKEALLKMFSEVMGSLRLRIISDAEYDQAQIGEKWNITTDFDATCEDWLANIKNCRIFITDSFHGMCFAIIFNKPFIALDNKKRGSARLQSMASLLGLSNRLVSNLSLSNEQVQALLAPIDYAKVNKQLEKEIARSRTWLYQALIDQSTPPKAATAYDILDSRCDHIDYRLQQQIAGLRMSYQTLEAELNRVKSNQKNWDEYISKRQNSYLQKWSGRLKRGFLCCCQNGLIYTWKRFIAKLKERLSK